MIEFRDVSKVYLQGKREVRALDGFSAIVEKGEFVAVMGPSGSGKSTFLHLAGALDLPTSGTVRIRDVESSAMSDTERTLLRRRRLGFVFQFFNLIPTLTVHENVGLPLLLDGEKLSSVRAKVDGLLERVGLEQRQVHLPEELSGGEMQRVAIARSLVHDPELLLADEPTGNLDSATGTEIMELLREVASENGKTIVMVTHDAKVAGYANRTLHLRDGKLDESDPATLS